jgi:hypothetical protein
MKLTIWLGLSTALILGATVLQAQETNDVDALKKQLKEATDNFEKTMQEQRQVIDSLNKRLETMEKQQAAAADKAKLEKELAADLQTNATPAATALTTSWSPSQPITVARAGSAYMNISFDALMDFGWSTTNDVASRLQLGDHDPIKRGFSLRNAEISVDGAVDPYFKGYGNIVLKLDQNTCRPICRPRPDNSSRRLAGRTCSIPTPGILWTRLSSSRAHSAPKACAASACKVHGSSQRRFTRNCFWA